MNTKHYLKDFQELYAEPRRIDIRKENGTLPSRPCSGAAGGGAPTPGTPDAPGTEILRERGTVVPVSPKQ